MARHWEVAKIEILCGGCAKYLDKKTPLQVIEFPGVKRKHFRGPCCAEGEPPEEIREITDREILAERVESIRTIGQRVIAAAEWMPYKENREPGEDG